MVAYLIPLSFILSPISDRHLISYLLILSMTQLSHATSHCRYRCRRIACHHYYIASVIRSPGLAIISKLCLFLIYLIVVLVCSLVVYKAIHLQDKSLACSCQIIHFYYSVLAKACLKTSLNSL